MNTTYNDIFDCFVENCGVDTSQLPIENSKKYNMIINGIRHYNSMIDEQDEIGQLSYDNDTEAIGVLLDDTRLLMLAYCMKYVYLENQLVGFEELWSPFQSEIGIKNYKDQIKGRENTLDRTQQKILELLSKIEDKNLM